MQSSLDSIKELLAFGAWHTSTIKALMVYVREVLESNNLKASYGFTNLYCNWCVHVKISESTTAFHILLALTKAICKHNKNPNRIGELHKVINDTLGFRDFRKELVDLFQRFQIEPKRILDDESWKGFMNLLLEKLKEKPILFSHPLKLRFRKIYDDITNFANNEGQPEWAVIGLCFTHYGSYICWEIKTEDLIRRNVRCLGPVAIG
jgi:hypothetical protein